MNLLLPYSSNFLTFNEGRDLSIFNKSSIIFSRIILLKWQCKSKCLMVSMFPVILLVMLLVILLSILKIIFPLVCLL